MKIKVRVRNISISKFENACDDDDDGDNAGWSAATYYIFQFQLKRTFVQFELCFMSLSVHTSSNNCCIHRTTVQFSYSVDVV